MVESCSISRRRVLGRYCIVWKRDGGWQGFLLFGGRGGDHFGRYGGGGGDL